MIRKLLIGLTLIISGGFISAQQTGSFIKNFIFSSVVYPNQQRTMAYYVPATYSAAKKYKLFISMGGQGWAPASDLISPYGPSNPGTADLLKSTACASVVGDFIAVSPSISPQAKAAGAPDGTWPYPDDADDGLIEAIIAEVSASYNIDPNYVYLTGFSLGARGALYLGLNAHTKLRGMILYTPAVQGLNEAKNQNYYQNAANPYCKYSYSNSTQIPIVLYVGANDPNGAGCSYCTPADPVKSYATVIVPEVRNQIQQASGGSKLLYQSIAGVGHQRPGATYMCNALNFIDGFYTTSIAEQTPSTLTVYPNPTTGWLYFEMPEGVLNTSVEIFNWTGEKLMEWKNEVPEGGIDLSAWPAGMYFISIRSESGFRTREKILIAR